ncbi:SH3-like domain-containing protein [Loigolactobacillus coryniformis]|uniref:SH3-like domain-containing protein n=1 Tax=Loigolactobacillus coryniformis TaxID=1610 RepID=UPI000556D1B9|nr:SH3-like domain-containing protein [Loigolactobacillus coryniformis]
MPKGVNGNAVIISTRNGTRNDGLYLYGPYNTSATTKVPNSTVSRYENWGVIVGKIEKTSSGFSYAEVTSLDGKHTWWVDVRALMSV